MSKKTDPWDFEEEDNRKFDPEFLKHFITEGVDLKDQYHADGSTEVVDLHFEKMETSEGHYTNEEKIHIQVGKFEKRLDAALASGKKKLVVVHGKGTGKLKEAVITVLKAHPMVRSWREKSKGNEGALEIIL